MKKMGNALILTAFAGALTGWMPDAKAGVMIGDVFTLPPAQEDIEGLEAMDDGGFTEDMLPPMEDYPAYEPGRIAEDLAVPPFEDVPANYLVPRTQADI